MLGINDLMTQCSTCNGTGDDAGETCYKCDGDGYIPTETGRAVIEFVYRFMLKGRDQTVDSILNRMSKRA